MHSEARARVRCEHLGARRWMPRLLPQNTLEGRFDREPREGLENVYLVCFVCVKAFLTFPHHKIIVVTLKSEAFQKCKMFVLTCLFKAWAA